MQIYDAVPDDGTNDQDDFLLLQSIRLVKLHEELGNPGTVPAIVTSDLDDQLKRFRYHFDQPGDGYVQLSENHQIGYAAGELLAGERFPDETFGTGLLGREHIELAKTRLMRWFRDRGRFGYSEWLSTTYYSVELGALLNLVDFAQDQEVVEAAIGAVDLLCLDMALNSYKGFMGSTQGRESGTSGGLFDMRKSGVATEHAILFGIGAYSDVETYAGVVVATTKYEVPQVLVSIANDPSTFVNRQRHGIFVEEGPLFGYTYERDDIASAAFWYGMGAWTDPLVYAQMKNLAIRYNQIPLNPSRGFRNIIIAIVRNRRNARVMLSLRILAFITDGAQLQRANVYTYRNEDVMLSSVQSHLKGRFGFQQHAWQATMGNEAIVFTTHPGTLGLRQKAIEDLTFWKMTYWNGGASMPRCGQHENVALIIYRPEVADSQFRRIVLRFTHAYFPEDAFDEVNYTRNWAFARKGAGYVGLYSATRLDRTSAGFGAGREISAKGLYNIWICEVGSAATHGSFDEFRQALTAARVDASISQSTVSYTSPSQGLIEMGWDGPIVINGKPRDLEGHPRYENTFTETEWQSPDLMVKRGDEELHLDLEVPRRISTQ
ncbi:unnamed protein product [Chrysoparadoxa australica]